MKQTLISNRFSLAVAAGLALCAISTQAQDVAVTGSLTYVAAGGGVFDYALTLQNTGSEAVEGLWLGWALSSTPVFDIANPTAATNNLGWTVLVDGNSVKYGGSSSETTILPGGSGTFTFNSTSTPAQFMSGAAGQSVAYGVNATQFAIEDNSLHSVEFAPTVVLVPTNTVTITQFGLVNGNVVISGTNGQSGGTYYLLAATNLTKPLSQWVAVATNRVNTNGVNGAFTFTGTNVASPGAGQQFYILSSTNN
jgi:hypothetical protein